MFLPKKTRFIYYLAAILSCTYHFYSGLKCREWYVSVMVLCTVECVDSRGWPKRWRTSIQRWFAQRQLRVGGSHIIIKKIHLFETVPIT